MFQKRHARLWPCCVALLVMACGPSEAERRATNDCDIQAANPNDEQRVAPGASSTAIIPKLAVEACEKAVKSLPGESRFLYQLGRAYDAAGRPADAIKAYKSAMAKNHAMAFYNMGLKEAELGNVDSALALYAKGAELGSALAAREVAKSRFSSEGFSNPSFFQSIYDKNFAQQESSQKIYVSTFIGIFNREEECRGVATHGLTVFAAQQVQGAVWSQLLGAMRASQAAGTIGYREGQAVTAGMAMQVDRAENDAKLFYSRYACDGTVAKRFFQNLGQWLGVP